MYILTSEERVTSLNTHCPNVPIIGRFHYSYVQLAIELDLTNIYHFHCPTCSWGIKCCRILGKCTRDCSLLGPLNFVTATFNRRADPGHFFTGIYSIFDSDGSSEYDVTVNV